MERLLVKIVIRIDILKSRFITFLDITEITILLELLIFLLKTAMGLLIRLPMPVLKCSPNDFDPVIPITGLSLAEIDLRGS